MLPHGPNHIIRANWPERQKALKSCPFFRWNRSEPRCLIDEKGPEFQFRGINWNSPSVDGFGSSISHHRDANMKSFSDETFRQLLIFEFWSKHITIHLKFQLLSRKSHRDELEYWWAPKDTILILPSRQWMKKICRWGKLAKFFFMELARLVDLNLWGLQKVRSCWIKFEIHELHLRLKSYSAGRVSNLPSEMVSLFLRNFHPTSGWPDDTSWPN